MSDDDSQAVEGEVIGPEGPGRWLPVAEAQPFLGIAQKTIYRRIDRGRIPSRKNAEGLIEVWVPDAPIEERRLSPTVSVNTVEVHELLAPLAKALTDSQGQALENLERAVRAEMERDAALRELAVLKDGLSGSLPLRTGDTPLWRRIWSRLTGGDSQ